MPFRIRYYRTNTAGTPSEYPAWVRSIRPDGTFRYTSSPERAKTWLRQTAPQRALQKRAKYYANTKYAQHVFSIESFSNPHEVNPVQFDYVELEEHGLI